jgi:antitoxin ParD1/3/4
MTTATMNISLPEVMKGFIDTQLKAGGYGSASEYVRELIRKDQIAKAEAQLRDMLLEGINSGPAVFVDAKYFTELKARVKARNAHV